MLIFTIIYYIIFPTQMQAGFAGSTQGRGVFVKKVEQEGTKQVSTC